MYTCILTPFWHQNEEQIKYGANEHSEVGELAQRVTTPQGGGRAKEGKLKCNRCSKFDTKAPIQNGKTTPNVTEFSKACARLEKHMAFCKLADGNTGAGAKLTCIKAAD